MAALRLGSNLAIADAHPPVTAQPLQSHRTARANLVRADADLGAHSELAAIGEARGSIPINRRRIHLGEELFRMRFVLRNDAVGVRGSVMVDVVDRLPH